MKRRDVSPQQIAHLVTTVFSNHHVVALTPTEDAAWSGNAAWAAARAAAAGGRQVLLVDLTAGGPGLDEGASRRGSGGITDVFRTDGALEDVAVEQELPGLHYIARGTEQPGSTIWKHERWRRLARGFGNQGALLLLYTPRHAVQSLPIDALGIAALRPRVSAVDGGFRRGRRRLPAYAGAAAVTAVAGALVLAWSRGSGTEPSRYEPPAPRAVPSAAPSAPGEDSLYYSVQVAQHSTLSLAIEHAGEIDATGRVAIVTPARMGSQDTWYRVLVGALPTARAADSLLQVLWRDGTLERPQGTILRTPDAFRLTSGGSSLRDLRARGIPAYIVPAPDNTTRVYVGAFDLAEQAHTVDSLLAAADLAATLVRRTGVFTMKLTRLQLSGFKSFADTVDLVIEEGVTAIVGPNGCGKSNISDGVRWVLGEQRARLLRGARMEDIIFQGSAKRRPINISEVSLHFDNTEGTLPVPYGEVVVTRRLSRSGMSEYLVNQQPVRLRDVQDLLRGTGMGSDVGVVIESQAIERLLSDKAEERRSLFEEAAGIGLYRDRKTGTERRLEKTGEDLQRLNDVIGEVQTQVRSLARQRGRAERHKKLTDERFAVVMTLARRDLADCDRREQELRERRAQLREELPRAETALHAREQERESRVQDRATAEVRRTEVERRLATTRVEVERLEGDLNLAAERLANAGSRRSRAHEERVQAEARAAQATRERDAAAAERRAAEAARQSVQTELDLRSASEGEARSLLSQKRDEVRSLESSLQRLAEGLTALELEGSAVEREMVEVQASIARTEDRRNHVEGEARTAREQLDSARATLKDRERGEHEATSELDRSRHALAAARETEAALRIERRSAEEPLASLGARRGALEELERERVGLAPAARQLLDARAEFGDGVLGPVSDFVRVSQGGAPLVERLLGDWLNAVLVADDSVVASIEQWHARVQPGPLVLLPVSPGPRGDRGASAGVPGVSFLAPAEAWLNALLQGDQVLDRGAIRRANGAVFLAGGESSIGPLGRRAELDQVLGEIATAEARLADLQARADRASAAHAEAEKVLAEAETRAERARAAHRETLAIFDDALRAMQRLERERAEAEETLSRTVKTREERSARAQQIVSELAAARREREEADAGVRRLQVALADLEAAQEAARERRVHWQVEEAQVNAREQGAREREARAEETLGQARTEIEALDSETGGLERDLQELERTRAQWAEQLTERKVAAHQLEAAAGEAETAVTAADQALAEAEHVLNEARSTLQGHGEASHRLELQEAEATSHRRVLLERLEAEWQKPVAELLEGAPEVEGDAPQLREEAERLAREIEGIGPVNALAVEEHAEEGKRAEFLLTQRDDLLKAREALEQAVKEIDQTAKTLFVDTFNSIRANFQNVFHTLFEGGECDVRLADESDPLGSEIDIHAAPRGKRTQRIHLLSSGERALVAISLLFSIYLTKPSPFCVLDEVDAPLDDANVVRFVRLLDEFKADTQFIVITHNPRTMQVADAVYGVTMQEPGVSSIVGVRLGEVV